ncbi:MAG: hypothetical protein NTY19_03115, partial [Planctomycetota bacterium]|nr:hypothetical protein [Planctomycetota bacterium]
RLGPTPKNAERRQDGVPSPARQPGLSGLAVALWVGGSALVSVVLLAVIGWFFLVPLILPSKPVPISDRPASSRTSSAVKSRVRDAKGSRPSLPQRVQPETGAER